MDVEYHHEFPRNMNITSDISPINELLKTNSRLTLPMNFFWSFLPNWGTTCNTYLYFKGRCIAKVQQLAVKIRTGVSHVFSKIPFKYKYAKSHHYNVQEK